MHEVPESADPGRAYVRLVPFDDLVVRTQRSHPPRPGPAGQLGRIPTRRLGAVGGEVDDPPLAHAEDAVESAADEQGEVGESTECPVPDQDVAVAKFRV